MEIKKELIDELLKNYQKPEDVIGENGLLKQLTKALLERAMGAELTHHLGYEKSDPAGYHSGNSRNGTTAKTLKGATKAAAAVQNCHSSPMGARKAGRPLTKTIKSTGTQTSARLLRR